MDLDVRKKNVNINFDFGHKPVCANTTNDIFRESLKFTFVYTHELFYERFYLRKKQFLYKGASDQKVARSRKVSKSSRRRDLKLTNVKVCCKQKQ